MLHFRTLFFLLLTSLGTFSLSAQSNIDVEAGGEVHKIEILEADYLEGIRKNGTDIKILVGNVILKQNNTLMFCDSAVLHSSDNNVRAYGDIFINQGDTIKAWGDSLSYFGDDEIARLMSNVVLTDNSMELRTEDLDYNLKSRIARYRQGGEFNNKETVLTSTYGYYYAAPQICYFRDSVVLNHPKYILQADTLEYHVQSDIAYFHGPTDIFHQNNSVYCEGGSYDGQSAIAIFTDNAVLNEPPRTIAGDSIVYDQNTGIGKAWYNVTFIDTVENIIQESEYAEYYEESGELLSTERSIITYIIDGDSLYISGDTVKSSIDSLGNRELLVDGDVRVYKSDMQIICDSMLWKDADSSIYLFTDPVLWAQDYQFTGDTIIIKMKDQKLNAIELLRNAFLIGNPDTLIYNQVKGRYIYGYLRDNEIKRMKVFGNGESIYYADDDEKGYFGMNQSVSSDISIRFNDKKVDRISFISNPDATLFKMEGLDNNSKRLDGFNWREDEQPKSKEDLLTKPKVIVVGELEQENSEETDNSEALEDNGDSDLIVSPIEK
ncbi:MAG: lipopolysaccharide export system protein LptA [Limisphaerales bacterium]|jgi:lipopolysaccharide export system protein LptA